MAGSEIFKHTFDRVADSGMRNLEVQMIVNGRKKHFIASRIVIAVSAVILALILTNIISYAANGEAWITGVWKHAFVNNPNTGKDDMDQYTFEGDGYYIQVQHASVYDTEGNFAGSAGGGVINGVDVINDNDSLYLTFGSNKFDLTDQIKEKGYALLKISISDRVMVCVVTLHEIHSATGENETNSIYLPYFYDYDYVLNNEYDVIGSDGFISKEDIAAAPVYYADK